MCSCCTSPLYDETQFIKRSGNFFFVFVVAEDECLLQENILKKWKNTGVHLKYSLCLPAFAAIYFKKKQQQRQQKSASNKIESVVAEIAEKNNKMKSVCYGNSKVSASNFLFQH